MAVVSRASIWALQCRITLINELSAIRAVECRMAQVNTLSGQWCANGAAVPPLNYGGKDVAA